MISSLQTTAYPPAIVPPVTAVSLDSQIQLAFSETGYSGLQRVSCVADVELDQVTLLGRVECFYLKQVAQTIAAKTPGVAVVVNNILVD